MRLTRNRLGLLAVAGCLLTLSIMQAQEKTDKPAAKPSEFKTVKQKVSYGFGMDIGQNIARNMQGQQIDVDNAALLQGITDAIHGAESRVSDDEMQAALKIFQTEMIAKAKIRRAEAAKKRIEADPKLKAQSDKNVKDGAAFVKANKAKKGVTTTASG